MAAALGGLAYFFITLDAANARIDEQDRQLEEQSDLIDKKETFGAAMEALVDTTTKFDGVLLTTVVPIDDYELLASRAWAHRWDATKLAVDTADVRAAVTELEGLLSAASTEASTNVTGTTHEAVIDRLSAGFATSVVDDADTLCETDVLGCVISDNPTVVHFDAADISLPYMDERQRTGLAYHEFAHVLQFANPGPTETAVASFGGDVETMADCFALTFFDGWTLDSRVWVSSYSYYNVSVGYGYTCNDAQKQVIRDWYSQLGFQSRPISQ